MPSHLLQEVLAELLAKRPQTLEERAAIDAAIAVVVRGMQGGGNLADHHQAAVEALAAASQPETPPRTLSQSSPYYGLGLKEAAPKVLSITKKPMVAREIWEVLKAEGYQTAHSDPVHAVHDALRRRTKTHGDVLLIGEGRWGRPEWYTEDELKEIDKSMGGMGGRDRGSHVERTKRGMAVAKARGARIGAQSKLSEEQWAEAERMLREGKSPQQVADHFSVVRQTIYNRFGRDRIRELRGLPKRTQQVKDSAGETRH